MNNLRLNLFKYILNSFNRYMRHSMFDFILDLKNIQTINKRKTKDYYTIRQKSKILRGLNLTLFFMYVLFCYKVNRPVLRQLLIFLLCLLIFFFPKCGLKELGEKLPC